MLVLYIVIYNNISSPLCTHCVVLVHKRSRHGAPFPVLRCGAQSRVCSVHRLDLSVQRCRIVEVVRGEEAVLEAGLAIVHPDMISSGPDAGDQDGRERKEEEEEGTHPLRLVEGKEKIDLVGYDPSPYS